MEELVMAITKICVLCGVEKRLEEFYKHQTNRDGRQSECSSCQRERMSLHRTEKQIVSAYAKVHLYEARLIDQMRTDS